MRILAFIEEEEVVEKILKHVGLWNLKVRPQPKVKAASVTIEALSGVNYFFLPTTIIIPDSPLASKASCLSEAGKPEGARRATGGLLFYPPLTGVIF